MAEMRDLLKNVNAQVWPLMKHPLIPAQVRECIGEMVLLLQAMTDRIEKLEQKIEFLQNDVWRIRR